MIWFSRFVGLRASGLLGPPAPPPFGLVREEEPNILKSLYADCVVGETSKGFRLRAKDFLRICILREADRMCCCCCIWAYTNPGDESGRSSGRGYSDSDRLPRRCADGADALMPSGSVLTCSGLTGERRRRWGERRRRWGEVRPGRCPSGFVGTVPDADIAFRNDCDLLAGPRSNALRRHASGTAV